MSDKVLSPVWTTPVHVDYVGSELAEGLVADVADPTVAGMRPLNGT